MRVIQQPALRLFPREERKIQSLINFENMPTQSEPKRVLPSTEVHDVAGLQDNPFFGLEDLTADIGESSSENGQNLQEYIRSLEAKAQSLRDLERRQEPSKLQLLYRLTKNKTTTTYFDHPEWAIGENRSRTLQSTLPLANIPLYLQMNKDIAFIVFRDFDVHEILKQRSNGGPRLETDDNIPPVRHTSEGIYSVSKDLSVAIASILDSRSEFSDLSKIFKTRSWIPAPYLFIYHSRDSFDELVKPMSEKSKRQLSIFSNYINTEFKLEYEAADELLSRGRISMAYVKFLFKPNDTLVQVEKGKFRAYISKSWPLMTRRQLSLHSDERKKFKSLDIEVWSWRYNGKFQREHGTIPLQLSVQDVVEQEIESLNVCPLKYVSHKVVEMLEQRGKTFWKCRHGHLVSYKEDEGHERQNSVRNCACPSSSRPRSKLLSGR